MTTHQESAQIAADQMIARAKEAGVTSMGIEYREKGRVTSGVLRCTFKYSVTKSRISWVLTNAQYLGAMPKSLTKAEAIALIADHYDMTCDKPAAEPAKAPTKPAALPVPVPATETPAFRRIVHGTCGEFLGYAGEQYRARFDFECDALEWRAADPLNSGTIGELAERELHRKQSSDYQQFLIDTAAKLNAMNPAPIINDAYIFLTKECGLHGFNRAATSVRKKDGKFEVYACAGRG